MPVYLSEADRAAHRHVLGKTGSGKTTSVLWPQVYQDAADGHGMVILDAKGSDENVRTLKAIAAKTGRQKDLRILCLPAWNEPELFTHRYNVIHVEPRSLRQRGGDPVPVAERFLSVLPLGDELFYKTQARTAFLNLCKLLHGMVDERGYGFPFNLEDVAACLDGVGLPEQDARALHYCLDTSQEKHAAQKLAMQFKGARAREALSGLVGGIESFQSDIVNAYAPDIVIDDVLHRGLIFYAQCPSNLFKLQAPALGKALLMDLQQAGARRQMFRRQRSQRPFSVVVDEFATFADLSIIASLNQLRDANVPSHGFRP